MKIYILGSPGKESSGVKTHCYVLNSEFLKMDIDSEIISSYPKGLFKFFLSLPLKIIRIINKNYGLYFQLIFINKWYFTRLVKNIIKTNSNEKIVLIFQSVEWLYALRYAKKRANTKSLLTVHGSLVAQLEEKGYSNKIIKIYKKIEFDAYDIFDNIIAVSDKVKRLINNVIPNKNVEIINNGVRILSNSLENEIHSNKLIFFGGLYKYKGAHVILEAMKNIDNNEAFEVGIYGNGPDYNFLLGKISEYKLTDVIHMYGSVSNEVLLQQISHYGVAIIPSLPYGEFGEESLPYSCLEAMSKGLIVIASRTGGLKEIIEHGINGFLFDPGNDIELSELIIRISRNVYDLNTIRIEGLRTVKNRYSSKKMAENFVSLVEKVN